MKTFIGMDIGGTAIKIGLVNENGQLLFSEEYPVKVKGSDMLLKDVVVSVGEKFKIQCESAGYTIHGVGVSATGQIDGQSGIVVGTGGNILGWDQVNLVELLEPIFHVAIVVENDVNCVALAEQWQGNGKGFKHLFVYTIGTGIGGALILNNELYTGARGIAGEFGHTSIDYNGDTCHCKSSGCFETYGSMTALMGEIQKVNKYESLDGRQFFKELESPDGKRKYEAILEKFIHYHVVAITNVVHLLNPEVIIIGGGVSAQKELLVDPIIKGVKQRAMPNFTKNLIIIPALLGNTSGMIGAVRNLLNRIEEQRKKI